MKTKHLITLLIISGLFSGCVGTLPTADEQTTLKSKTANFFGTTPENITLKNFEAGVIATGFKAVYQGTLYNCYEHNLYGIVECKKPGF